ncbi:SurA N-terminal domain-containing protein [Buchnera aphidicola]|uniref:Periplasmic chaperone PpiD n=1 Tax=Buchnera aphidicola str. Ua (Uroleucon ambrosiae) TaxID=1005057 RepID=G2LPW4_BUCUM|nr:SurA N-terminal domain-containing protein [Buchnera aphidicola]AEO08251.1 peptidyl-prolyl cis-trans isomerase D [Buchnera aphidicola str. Ua (Uroleucon ambrosiae)]
MKKHSQSRFTHIIGKCILGIIILSLILSTINGYIHQNSEKYIAVVNGEKINLSTFQKMYFIEQEKQKKILGKKFFKIHNNVQFIQQTYNYVISQLVNNVLLEQYAKKMQLQVNDSEIKKIIFNSSLFQKNKKFNKEQYLNYLTSINLTNREYIDIIKKKINTENLVNAIYNSNFILNYEKNNIIKLLSQKRIIKKAIIKTDSIINKQHTNDIEARKYFYQNRNNFYIPEKFKINFIHLNIDRFKTSCNNKEIYETYLKNIQKYSTKEIRRYSIIQTKTKKQALLILSKLSNAPKDFSKIAQKHSIDPISSKKGGDIGWISEDITPNEIKKANLQRKNQISNIITFKNEFLIIKLNDIKIAQPKKIDEVSDIIKKKIQHKKSLNLYNTFIHNISHVVKKHPNNIESIIKKNNFVIEKTNWFNKNSVPKNLNNFILKKIIFHKKLLQNHQIPKKYFHLIILKKHQAFLIKLVNFKNQEKQSFQNVRKNIIYKINLIKATKESQKKAEKIMLQLKKGKNNLFKKSHLYFSDPEIISRYDQNSITSIIFNLPRPKQGKKTYTLYQDKNNNFIIISLEKVYNTTFSPEENNMIIKYIEQNNNQIIFNSILKDLREKSVITYNKIEFDKLL